MGQIKWYKRDPSEALNGMMELTLEERGAYNTILDLIYSRDGNLPDDDRFISGWLRVDLRVWRRIKGTLIERGKLYIADGNLRNRRADVEVLTALSRVASAQEAGRASAKSKASKPKPKLKQNNGEDATDVETDVETGVSTNHNHTHTLPTEEIESPTGISHLDAEAAPKVTPDPADENDDPDVFTVKDFVESWNVTAAKCGLSKIRKLTDARKTAFRVRQREYPDIADWQSAFRCLAENKWMHGDNPKGWRADPDFFLQAKSFTKLVEGQYGQADR